MAADTLIITLRTLRLALRTLRLKTHLYFTTKETKVK